MDNSPRPPRRLKLFVTILGVSLALFGLFAFPAPPVTQALDPNLKIWSQIPFIKVRPSDPAILANNTVTVKGGKNETVSFQVVLTGQQAYSGLDVNLTAFNGP